MCLWRLFLTYLKKEYPEIRENIESQGEKNIERSISFSDLSNKRIKDIP